MAKQYRRSLLTFYLAAPPQKVIVDKILGQLLLIDLSLVMHCLML